MPPSVDAAAPASNQTEVFYARVPTSATGSSSSFDVLGEWRHIMGSTLHETTRITAVAERFANPVGTDLEDGWLEEGTVLVASETYARTRYGVAWMCGAKYANTVYCDLEGSRRTGHCAGAEDLMTD